MCDLDNEFLSVKLSFKNIAYIVNGSGKKIAVIFPQRDLAKEKAVAHLLAAAPDMYALLRSMVAVLGEYDAEADDNPFAAKEFFENVAEEFLVDAHEILRSAEGKTE